MEKLKPHYSLKHIKAAFADPAKLNRSMTSKQGADEMGMEDEEVVAVIQALNSADFQKSMTSHVDHKVWQDVYRTAHKDRLIYVKFTVDSEKAPYLISFKEA
jgi:motility quorum-sensing regulator / GCU-specific mRNA interferase toxin